MFYLLNVLPPDSFCSVSYYSKHAECSRDLRNSPALFCQVARVARTITHKEFAIIGKHEGGGSFLNVTSVSVYLSTFCLSQYVLYPTCAHIGINFRTVCPFVFQVVCFSVSTCLCTCCRCPYHWVPTSSPPSSPCSEGRKKSFERGNYPLLPTGIGERYSQTLPTLYTENAELTHGALQLIPYSEVYTCLCPPVTYHLSLSTCLCSSATVHLPCLCPSALPLSICLCLFASVYLALSTAMSNCLRLSVFFTCLSPSLCIHLYLFTCLFKMYKYIYLCSPVSVHLSLSNCLCENNISRK